MPWTLVKLDAGEKVPRDARRFSGLCFMGGPMSVNDELPWIAPALELIREAVRKDVPVIGHCLGGQLLAKALGGEVGPNPAKEIGWGEVRVCDNTVAREWLGDASAFQSFHWHGETFTIPPGATRILENEHCANQAFAVGKHLGMQCHVEMTPELIREWVAGGEKEIAESRGPSVQRPAQIEAGMANLDALREVANGLYDRWTSGLSRGSS